MISRGPLAGRRFPDPQRAAVYRPQGVGAASHLQSCNACCGVNIARPPQNRIQQYSNPQRLRPPRWTSHIVNATEASTTMLSRMAVVIAIIYRWARASLLCPSKSATAETCGQICYLDIHAVAWPVAERSASGQLATFVQLPPQSYMAWMLYSIDILFHPWLTW